MAINIAQVFNFPIFLFFQQQMDHLFLFLFFFLILIFGYH
jgi:hypothetical protein